MALQPYLRGAVLAEVDGVAAALVMVAVAAWIHDLRILAGIAYGYAMLITPLTTLSLPIFIAAHVNSKQGWRAYSEHAFSLLIFGIAALAIYAPFVLHYWHDYWEGGRGLLHAPRQPWDVNEQVLRSVSFFKTTALPWLWLAVLAGVAVVQSRPLALGTLIATVVAALTGEQSNPVD